MLTKLLITALIIVIAFIFIRFRNSQNRPTIRVINIDSETKNLSPKAPPSKNIKLVALIILSLSLVSGTVMIFLNWQDDHRLFDIKIINPQTGSADHYQAYKKDLKGRTFSTITGQQITVSELERIEFQEI